MTHYIPKPPTPPADRRDRLKMHAYFIACQKWNALLIKAQHEGRDISSLPHFFDFPVTASMTYAGAFHFFMKLDMRIESITTKKTTWDKAHLAAPGVIALCTVMWGNNSRCGASASMDPDQAELVASGLAFRNAVHQLLSRDLTGLEG